MHDQCYWLIEGYVLSDSVSQCSPGGPESLKIDQDDLKLEVKNPDSCWEHKGPFASRTSGKLGTLYTQNMERIEICFSTQKAGN